MHSPWIETIPNWLAIVCMWGTLAAVTIYMFDIARTTIPAHRKHTGTLQVIPIITWLVALPILVLAISNIGNLEIAIGQRFSLQDGTNHQVDVFTVAALKLGILFTFTTFICGFVRSFYTITLLDTGEWWEIRGLKRVMYSTSVPHQLVEAALRLLIIGLFVVHQIYVTDIMVLGQPSSGNTLYAIFDNLQELAMRCLELIGIQTNLHANAQAISGAQIMSAPAWHTAGITGATVFLLILAWSFFVDKVMFRTHAKKHRSDSDALSADELDVAKRQFATQRFACAYGVLISAYVLLTFEQANRSVLLSLSSLAIFFSMLFFRIVIRQVYGIGRNWLGLLRSK